MEWNWKEKKNKIDEGQIDCRRLQMSEKSWKLNRWVFKNLYNACWDIRPLQRTRIRKIKEN